MGKKMISAVVLAAGEARRMGTLKQLLPFEGGKTIVECVVTTLQKAKGIEEILVVVGHEGERVAAAIAHCGVSVVVNHDYKLGMLSSLQCGIRAAHPKATGILVVLGDQPHLQPAVIQKVIDAFSPDQNPGIVLPVYAGKRGHPTLLHSRFREEILALPNEVGLNSLLRAHPEEIQEVVVETDDILRDIDYAEDYQREREKLYSSSRVTEER